MSRKQEKNTDAAVLPDHKDLENHGSRDITAQPDEAPGQDQGHPGKRRPRRNRARELRLMFAQMAREAMDPDAPKTPMTEEEIQDTLYRFAKSINDFPKELLARIEQERSRSDRNQAGPERGKNHKKDRNL